MIHNSLLKTVTPSTPPPPPLLPRAPVERPEPAVPAPAAAAAPPLPARTGSSAAAVAHSLAVNVHAQSLKGQTAPQQQRQHAAFRDERKNIPTCNRRSLFAHHLNFSISKADHAAKLCCVPAATAPAGVPPPTASAAAAHGPRPPADQLPTVPETGPGPD